MLYLEDYLEMIEHLPQELKDRFTEIRELDLQVQNATDKLEDRVKVFFAGAKKQKTPEREAEFEAIRTEYYKVLEDADEKVHQANQMYELVEKYLRKLDQELYKFKMELEADNAGITEVLEKRSLEMDVQHQPDLLALGGVGRDKVDYLSQKENRYQSLIKTEKVKAERKNSHEKSLLLPTPSPRDPLLGGSAHTSGTTTPIAYSLGHMGVGGTAIAAAASQAIAATQQMQQGRRTASLKASYDAVNLGLNPQDFIVGKDLLNNAELHQAAQQALAATGCGSGEQKRNKRKSHHTHNQELMSQPADELVDGSEGMAMDTVEPHEWTAFVDPSEPRYCVCNEVSYGDMVACDNADCTIEWFHYGCVGITATPKGKWYCPSCSASMKRRGRR